MPIMTECLHGHAYISTYVVCPTYRYSVLQSVDQINKALQSNLLCRCESRLLSMFLFSVPPPSRESPYWAAQSGLALVPRCDPTGPPRIGLVPNSQPFLPPTSLSTGAFSVIAYNYHCYYCDSLHSAHSLQPSTPQSIICYSARSPVVTLSKLCSTFFFRLDAVHE